MNSSDKEQFAIALRAIAEKLDACEQVRRYDSGDEKQAWTLASTFLDLAESFRTFLDQQLPQVTAGTLDCEQMTDLLVDIGEEFRHILYHIRDAKFYEYLRD